MVYNSAKNQTDTRYTVTAADKKGNTPAYQNYKKGMKSKITGKAMTLVLVLMKRLMSLIKLQSSFVLRDMQRLLKKHSGSW